jgi:hypothetical protein
MTEKCQYLPDQDCVPEACLNSCHRRGFPSFPVYVSNGYGNFSFKSQEEYEAFIKACPHTKKWTERGCDGVYAFEHVYCDRCGLMLERSGEVVWNK